jgi:hypothetical protein
MVYLIALWLLIGAWRAYNYLVFDVSDEGCLFFYHITNAIGMTLFGVLSWVEYHFADVIIIGYYPSSKDRYDDGRYFLMDGKLYLLSRYDRMVLGEQGNCIGVVSSGIINKLFGLHKTARKDDVWSMTEYQFDELYRKHGIREMKVVDGGIVIGAKITL